MIFHPLLLAHAPGLEPFAFLMLLAALGAGAVLPVLLWPRQAAPLQPGLPALPRKHIWKRRVLALFLNAGGLLYFLSATDLLIELDVANISDYCDEKAPILIVAAVIFLLTEIISILLRPLIRGNVRIQA